MCSVRRRGDLIKIQRAKRRIERLKELKFTATHRYDEDTDTWEDCYDDPRQEKDFYL